jgi:hypothetical protein
MPPPKKGSKKAFGLKDITSGKFTKKVNEVVTVNLVEVEDESFETNLFKYVSPFNFSNFNYLGPKVLKRAR